jgi:hypothetical protein
MYCWQFNGAFQDDRFLKLLNNSLEEKYDTNGLACSRYETDSTSGLYVLERIASIPRSCVRDSDSGISDLVVHKVFLENRKCGSAKTGV